MKPFQLIKNNLRVITLVGFTALSNGYVNGFLEGKIYQGPSKKMCVPGLNCYSCPGALGSCPIGALQAVITSKDYQFSFYVIGLLMGFGAIFGRTICGWLCPFGWVQDVLYKIPVFNKKRRLPYERVFNKFKYLILILFVILLPIASFGGNSPWFCKVICPSGTLMAGIPLVLTNPLLQNSIGWLFNWKLFVLMVIVIASIKIYRPFCRYLCPLGAVYSVFNPISLNRLKVDLEKCTSCGLCQNTCGMDLPVFQQPNSLECIRCGKCIKACPHQAIKSQWF